MLAECGLVSAEAGLNPETGAEIRERRYRLRDNYSRFYLKFVEPVARMIDDGSYRFSSLSMLDGWNSVMGLAFENLKPYQRRGGAQAVVWFNEAEDRAKVVPNAGLEGTFDWVHQSAEVYVPVGCGKMHSDWGYLIYYSQSDKEDASV